MRQLKTMVVKRDSVELDVNMEIVNSFYDTEAQVWRILYIEYTQVARVDPNRPLGRE